MRRLCSLVTQRHRDFGNFRLTDENGRAVAQICRKLDGLPLAIELAAARIRLLDPHDLANRLDNSLALLTGGARDLPARQQTLRATVDWSYQLLSEADRKTLRALGVFQGMRAAAESVVKATFPRVNENDIKRAMRLVMQREVDALRLRPHPYEFFLYYDV